MKIIPDQAYVKFQCACVRVGCGTKRIVPEVAARIPAGKVRKELIGVTALGVTLSPFVVAFRYPEVMFVITLAWLAISWFLGECPECSHAVPDDASQEEGVK